MPRRMNSSILRYDATEERHYTRNSVGNSRACPMMRRRGSSMVRRRRHFLRPWLTHSLDFVDIASRLMQYLKSSHQVAILASPTPTMTMRNKDRRCQMALLPRGDAMRSTGQCSPSTIFDGRYLDEGLALKSQCVYVKIRSARQPLAIASSSGHRVEPKPLRRHVEGVFVDSSTITRVFTPPSALRQIAQECPGLSMNAP